ncbi:TonB-dependent receptor [Jiulongibacter sediminis]|uniref:TonB-dependent receptor n=1 Tax=Jiulongibacter sediminis TaxID=1605367 RepID=UPI0026E9BD0E|nr:TonB-dependent receptor [Jiulongibacter sediminis]
MKLPQLLLCFLLTSFFASAQNRITVSGHIEDSSGTALSYTSVLILAPSDSSLITYALTNDEGDFIFKNLERKPMLIKATYVSYLPHQEELVLPETGDLNLEKIVLNPISKELYEVVVKTAKAPISIKGDTIEYDASKFKVPPGATLEELIRKLPGVEVDKDGNVVAQGEQVQKVTVDGRRFFGNNTKVATQNLNADAVKKVQFFDDKSEQSKLTGVQDGVREKTMNVELKEEAKKGGFGKITASAGTDNRWNTSGLFNRFDKEQQFSVIGYGNNTNQSGITWDDLQEFQGSGAYKRNSGIGDFGFNNNVYYSSSNSEESFNIPYNDLSSGYSNNQAAGINYNYLKKKKELNSSYFFSRSDQQIDTYESRINLLNPTATFETTDQSIQENLTGHHRLNIRFQNEIDSSNTLTLIGQGRYSNLNNSLSSLQSLIRSVDSESSMQRNNVNDKFSMSYQGSAIFRHKFKKNGRVLALSFLNNGSKADTEGTLKTAVDVLNSSDPDTYFRNLDQLNASLNGTQLIKSSALYVEPIGKKVFSESFYNYSVTNSTVHREVYDLSNENAETLNEDLSRYFDNRIVYNRFGSSFRFTSKGNNLSLGLAGVRYDLNGDFSVRNSSPSLGQVDKTYMALTPNVDFNKRMKGNQYMGFDYSLSMTPPSISDLQPFKDISNPLFIRKGNPDLQPETSHSFTARYNKYDPATFIRFYIYARGSLYTNRVVQNQTINPETLVTTYSPGNVSGGNSGNIYGSFGFPIIKTKFSVDIGGSPSFSNYISLINNVENNTSRIGYNYNASITLTPIDWFAFYAGARISNSETKYEINTQQNQKIINRSLWARMNLKLPKDFYIDSNFDYSHFSNERLSFDQKVPIWNAFLYKQLGEKKKWEVRLSGFDILKRNINVTQQASQNYVLFREINTLSRYFLLGFTYNMRGVEVKRYR